jgi:hypothetical protein
MLTPDYHSDSILEIVQRENLVQARELLDHRELLSDDEAAFVKDLIARPALHPDAFGTYWKLQAILRRERVEERSAEPLTAVVSKASHYS